MMGLESWLKKKMVKKENGVPIFYIVYRPQNELPNVITHHTHPELREEEGLDELLKEVSDKVRGFYEKHPELLDEVIRSVK